MLVLLLAGKYTPTDLTISQSLARGSHIGFSDCSQYFKDTFVGVKLIS